MNVLIVEDDPDMLALLSMMLERQGWHVDIAANLGDGKAALLRTVYDVLISDLHLPDGHGTSLLEPERPGGLRAAILVTGAGEEERRPTWRNMGFDQFLTKPIDGTQIVARLRSLDQGT